MELLKILDFSYIDSKNNVTSRRVIPIAYPSDNYLTIDITELDVDTEYDLMEELNQLEEHYINARNTILKSHDAYKFRSFKRERMSNIVELPE